MSAVDQIVQAADQAVRSGRWAEAERLWIEVRKLQPNHPRALYSLGVHALQRNDLKPARDLLVAAAAASPRELIVLHTLSVAQGRLGDVEGEIATINAALAVDPYFLPCLLAKAGWLERHAGRAAAAAMYANCLKVAPPEPHWPEHLRALLAHARAFGERHASDYHDFLSERLAPLMAGAGLAGAGLAGIGQAEAERWREAASIMAGRSKPYLSASNQLYVPRLPAIPFYDRSMFPWAAELESKTDAIRDELAAALAKEKGEFSPYITYQPGDPVNQWGELNHSNRWSVYSLWKGGAPVDAHLAACPQTRAALEAVDMATIDGLCPNAMFSALAPHTEIPPHHGESNARLVVHLPLIVPEKCTYRVGFEHRQWRVGELLAFDDTLEHTARNDSDELRVVLIFDIWNPLLSLDERAMVSAMAQAARAFAEL